MVGDAGIQMEVADLQEGEVLGRLRIFRVWRATCNRLGSMNLGHIPTRLKAQAVSKKY